MGTVCCCAVLGVQGANLCDVKACVYVVFHGVSRIYISNGFGDFLYQNFGVFQREPDVFVVLGFFVVMMLVFVFFGVFMMVFMFLFGLHAFDDFFGLDAVAQCLEQVHLHALFVGRCFKCLFDPFVRFATDVHDHIGLGDCRDVGSRGLVTVQVHAVLDQERKVQGISLVAKDFFEPGVLRVNGGDNGNLFAVVCRLFRILLFGIRVARYKECK